MQLSWLDTRQITVLPHRSKQIFKQAHFLPRKKSLCREAEREQAAQRAAQARAYSGEGRHSEEWGFAFFGSASQ